MGLTSTPGLSDATFGIVCALPKELSAVRAVFDCVADPTTVRAASGRKYALAEVATEDGGRHVVAVALLPEMGNNAAAIRATRLLDDCPSVIHLLMVGIAGAVPHPESPEHHVRLGDIVVSDRGGVIQYDLVKEADDGAIEHRNAPRAPSSELLEAVNWLRSDVDLGNRPWELHIERGSGRLGLEWRRPASDQDVLDDLGDGTPPVAHPEDRDRRAGHPRVFHGPIAAANILLKSAARRDELRRKFGAKAVEMEGSGIADAAWDGRVGYLVIRGTCDYCNKNKNDAWQKHAAVAAASYARALIESIPAPDPVPPPQPALSLAGPPEGPSPHPDLRYLYDRAFEHGQLSERLAAVPSSAATQGAVARQAAESVRLALPPVSADGAFTAPTPEEESRRTTLRIRAQLDSYDHELASEAARGLERLLAEQADVLPPTARKEAFELLVDVEIIEFKRMRHAGAGGASTARARQFLAQAKDVSGGAEDDPWLIATEAYLDSLERGADAGLERLRDRNDPQAMRRRLAILLDQERFQEAADTVGGRTPERAWCEKAVTAFAHTGELDRAREIIRWAGEQDDPAPRRRTILCYAEGRLAAAFRNRGKEDPVIPGSLDDTERSVVGDTLQALSPLLQLVRGNGRVVDALEEHAVYLALQAHLYLEDRTEAEALAALLVTRRPVPLVLAHLALTANLPTPDDLPRRLREEHPGSYEASRMALLLEARRPGGALAAFEEALRVDVDALRKEDRPRHFHTLYALAQEIGEDAMRKVERLAPGLLAPDLDSLKLFLADRYLVSNRTEAAREILEELRAEDDPRWLQLHAHLMHRTGDPDLAMRRLIEASRRVPEADLFRKIAHVAYGLGRFDVVAESLRKVIALDPTDVASRTNLAGALTKVGDPQGAAEQFRKLREAEPDDPWHALNEAASLAYAGRLEEGLAVYEACCRADSPRLEAVLGRAEILRLLDRSPEAFRWLDGIREAWWGEPRFVLLYMSIAYAAGMDDQASSALTRLVELQRAGGAPAEILRAVSVEDLKQDLAGHRAHDEAVSDLLLRGEVPWVMVEEGRRRVPYLGWSVRTQPLDWCPDAPHQRAELSLYATNGYCVVGDADGGRDVVRIECPGPATTVAIDLSALYTLHALGLLDAAAGYFGKILVPASYLGQVLEERSRLLPHQRSQKTALEHLRGAIDAGRIVVVPGSPQGEAGALPIVDEYADDAPGGARLYRVLDVFEPIYAIGRVTRTDYDRALRAFSRETRPRPSVEAPRLFSPLLFDLFTLLVLDQVGCLDPVLNAYRVRISSDAEAEVARGLREFRFRDEVRSAHGDLWSRVRADARYAITPAVAPRQLGADPESAPAAHLALGASWIAAERSVPLLVDDRVLQVVTQNEARSRLPAAFGTDRLVERLGEECSIPITRAVDATLQLMRWRYRFVLPSPGVLKHLLDRYKEHPPGIELREVADYVHDCMRDPGLFSGFEPTTPPTSLASQLRQGWIAAVSRFVMEIWADEGWSEADARGVTTWAMRQLLPSLPATMPGAVQGAHARLEHRLVLTMALIASVAVEDPKRANTGG